MSTVKVNTLTGTSTAGSIVVTGEGNSTTTNLQQGLAKVWGLFNGTGTIAIRDSFNVSGITDLAVGKMTVSKTNAMDSVNYTTALRSDIDDAAGASRTYNPEVYTRAAGSFNFVTYSTSAEEDHAYDEVTVHGDLA
mgnify:FL=1|tara:strand:+ start:369 stop:776 length:408 start_codon:yes stop_codon:yes gene_type:complete